VFELHDWPEALPPVVSPADLPPQPARARIKVLHIVTKFEAGAGGNTLLSATGMDRRRYELWIVGSQGGPLWEIAERAGVRTVPLPNVRRELAPLADLVLLGRLLRLIRQERFTVVHTHNAKAGFLGRLAAWLSGTPVIVYTLHGRDPWWRTSDQAERRLGEDIHPGVRRSYLALERSLRRVTHAFVAVAPQVARDAVESGIAPPGKVVVVPSAVEVDAVPTGPDAQARVDLRVSVHTPLIGTVGRLDAQKDPLNFIRMARLVADIHPDARFVWVGDGPLIAAARVEARRLGIPVMFTGYRTDAPRVASAFDVYVVSSRYEGVGRSLTEAMAAGRPVVATAVDGVNDVVIPGATGLLARAGDPAGLARGVLWMLAHPHEANEMGAQAELLVRSLFTQPVMCGQLDRLYRTLLGIPPIAPGGFEQFDRQAPGQAPDVALRDFAAASRIVADHG
jgi:glycosyltransferase involved in cell wall biosynthesis